MRTITTFAIYWIPSGYTCGALTCAAYEGSIDQYLNDVAAASGSHSNVYSDATQYSDTTGPIAYQSTFDGGWIVSNPFPASGCPTSVAAVCLTDAQLRSELSAIIAGQNWPTGVGTEYFLMTPEGVGSCFYSSSFCSGSTFCAYHSWFTTGSGTVIYANEPYDAGISGCSDGNSPSGDEADATINTIGHEQMESMTDPLQNGWYSDAEGSQTGEVGDLCAWNFGTPVGSTPHGEYNQVINGDYYWVQQMYSNDGSQCVQRYPSIPQPANSSAPVVSGTAAVGQTLSATSGTWTGSPTSYAYQWRRCSGTTCTNISGATSTTYAIQSADVSYTLDVVVSATNDAGTVAAASSPTAQVVGVPKVGAMPRISGKPKLGGKLRATTGTWNGPPTGYAYQWLRCNAGGGSCSRIAGATTSGYTVAKRDAGHRLRVLVTASDAAGQASAESAATKLVPKKR